MNKFLTKQYKYLIYVRIVYMKRFLVYLRKIREMSARKKSYAIAFLLMGSVLLWAFLSAGFLTDGFSRSNIKSGNNRQELEVSSMILTETKEDKKFWEIYGETGIYNSDEKIALLKNVIGNFYKDNEVAMSFESSQGTYNEEKNQIILYDKTYIVLKDGITLNADRLVWSGSDKDIVATGNIKINKNGEMTALGDEVIISPNYNHFKLKGKTTSKIFDKNNKNSKKKKGLLFK